MFSLSTPWSTQEGWGRGMAPFILINKLDGAKRATGSRETNSPPSTERVRKSSTGQHPEIVKPVRIPGDYILQWHLPHVDPPYGNWCISPFWRLQFWGGFHIFFLNSVHPIPEPLTSYPVLPSTPRPPLSPLHILQLAISYATHNSEPSFAKCACFATPSPDCWSVGYGHGPPPPPLFQSTVSSGSLFH